MRARAIKLYLASIARPDKARVFHRFFKSGPGEYGEGDQFIGITVPVLHQAARQFADADDGTLTALLASEIHEHRLLALLILVRQFERGATARREVARLYLAHLDRVNNWDLVDVSAPKILGPHLQNGSRKLLLTLARSRSLWRRRVAVLATFHFIRQNDFVWTLNLAAMLLHDPHDLMHKAIGWMLREVGKREEPVLRAFLDQHATVMPRTMLRYAVERLPVAARQRYMAAAAQGT
jgi:3-methyladenine DNA glycosylase AlkD